MSSQPNELQPVQEEISARETDQDDVSSSTEVSDDEDEASSQAAPSAVSFQLEHPAVDEESETSHDYTIDLAASRVGRSSRASSIFSTRTRLSNLTLDDARSIEIIAGGQSFRISRDGSRVTDVTAPPPYPGPPDENIPEDEADLDSFVDVTEQSDPSVTEESDQQTPRLRPYQPSPNEEIEADLLTSNSSRLDLSSSVFEIPAKLKRAFGVNSLASSPSIPKFSVTSPAPDTSAPLPPPPRRTQSDTSNYAWFRPWSRASTENLAAANKNLSASNQKPNDEQRPSTSYAPYEKGDDLAGAGSNFEAHKRGYSHRSLPDQLDLVSSTSTITESEEDDYEDEDDERAAEISSHYSRVMRDLDREHRRKLHERDKELSQLRQLLHEKDIVYRQQLRDKDLSVDGLRSESVMKDSLIESLKRQHAQIEESVRSQSDMKDGVIESLKQRLAQAEVGLRSHSDMKDSLVASLKQQLAAVEEGLEIKLEKARNSVEDMWEKRWKAHEKLLLERLKQPNGDSEKPDTYGQVFLEASRASFDEQYNTRTPTQRLKTPKMISNI